LWDRRIEHISATFATTKPVAQPDAKLASRPKAETLVPAK
jgi:hypothetical protein